MHENEFIWRAHKSKGPSGCWPSIRRDEGINERTDCAHRQRFLALTFDPLEVVGDVGHVLTLYFAHIDAGLELIKVQSRNRLTAQSLRKITCGKNVPAQLQTEWKMISNNAANNTKRCGADGRIWKCVGGERAGEKRLE